MAASDTPYVTDMREWGLARPGELDRVTVVAPGPGDALLGCANLLAAHPDARVVTVFAATSRARDDDRAALAELGAEPVWMGLVPSASAPAEAGGTPEQIAPRLEDALRALGPTAVFAPFGLAHPDHDRAHRAAMLVRDRLPGPAWYCYEDIPHKHVPGALAARVRELFRAGVWPTPTALPVDPDPARKRTALARDAAQISVLETEFGLDAKLRAPTPEQYWRLAPPPPGWERLSDPSST